MLKSLRIKFVVIIMSLVGLVLITVLGGTLYSAWQTQHDMIYNALERSLNDGIYEQPRIGFMSDQSGTQNRPNIFVLKIDVDQDWVVVATNDMPATIDATVLQEVLETARTSEQDEGEDKALHIAWRRKLRSEGSWRVVIADTSYANQSLQSIAIKNIGITLVALCALLVISIGLSTWILKPVEEAWEQQRRFVADASHELKTPLAVIIANTQILAKDNTISAQSQRWIQSTADESTHMKNLVEELLELARTDESSTGSQGIMAKEDVDFSEMVETATLEFDAVAFERGCQIDATIKPDIHVTGDPEWLNRLAKILIDNACKYASQDSSITVTLAREGKRCTLAVNNQGQTIDPEDLPHVFDRFYRSDKARSRDSRAGGFGLGLAIAKGIATSHGGTIEATSSDQAGTTFTVVLPTSHRS